MRHPASIKIEPSERDLVMHYLWRRINVAFDACRDEEAQGLNRFYSKLEEMTDDEYEEEYS